MLEPTLISLVFVWVETLMTEKDSDRVKTHTKPKLPIFITLLTTLNEGREPNILNIKPKFVLKIKVIVFFKNFLWFVNGIYE